MSGVNVTAFTIFIVLFLAVTLVGFAVYSAAQAVR